MSEEKKIVELSEEDLENVTAGVSNPRKVDSYYCCNKDCCYYYSAFNVANGVTPSTCPNGHDNPDFFHTVTIW